MQNEAKSSSDNKIEYMKRLYSGTKFCLVWVGDEVTNFVEQRRVVRRGCSSSLGFFNIIVCAVIYHISESNVNAAISVKMSTPGLLFTDDVDVGLFIVG